MTQGDRRVKRVESGGESGARQSQFGFGDEVDSTPNGLISSPWRSRQRNATSQGQRSE